MNKIIRGDSEKVLKKFPCNSIDIIFTSPPYNFGLDYNNYCDEVDWNSYFDKLFRIFKECIRALKYVMYPFNGVGTTTVVAKKIGT